MDDLPSRLRPRVNSAGLSVLHDPTGAIADIIFVHGLQGHPRKTWACKALPDTESQSSSLPHAATHKSWRKRLFRKDKTSKDAPRSQDEEVFWPYDLLSEDCESARIITWGYDSKVSHFFGGAANQSNISDYAKNLLQALKRCRLNYPGRSLIFVAHSLGGIIVKDVLRRAAAANADSNPETLDIFTSTEAVFFLGTPHRGSTKAGIAEEFRRIAAASGFDTTDRNIRALQVDSMELQMIHELFMTLYEQKDRRFQVLTFQEAKGVAGVSYLGLNERVVEPSSSSLTGTEPTQIIDANHMSMCRFSSKNDEGYKQILGEIQFLLSKMQKRREGEARGKEKETVSIENGSPAQTTVSSVAYSFTEGERRCIALLTQNTSNAAEYMSSLPNRVEGTCEWILSDTQYREWYLQKETCLLWISGYPGSGKTILSAYLLECLSAGGSSPSVRSTLCYFFCDAKNETQRDAKAILRSIIHQLLTRRRLLIKYVKTAYDYYGPQLEQNFGELWKIFLAIASDERVGPVSVIIDAIDECEETTRQRLLQDVVGLIGSNHRRIKFLVTSRPFLGRQYTTNLLQIDPSQSHVAEDLRLVIRTKLERIAQRTKCKPDVMVYLENALYSRADRTFLWVTLVLHLLEKSFLSSQKDFARIIDELPKTLTATYERFLHGIPDEYQSDAIKLLNFLVGSSRPLKLTELRVLFAIQDHHRTTAAVEDDAQSNIQETLEGILGPLVRIWDGQVHLVHQSLKDFLQVLSTQSNNPLSATYGVNNQKASLLLAEACVWYLSLDDFGKDIFSEEHSSIVESPTSPVATGSDTDLTGNLWDSFDLEDNIMFKETSVSEAEACTFIGTQYVLFDYAARHWAEYFSSACTIASSELQASVMLLSDACSPRGLNWFRFYWFHAEPSLPYPQDFAPIVTASYFNHPTTLNLLLQDDTANAANFGPTGLYWASRMGHAEVVDVLLKENIDPDQKIYDGQNSLTAAISFNRLDVVKLLLEDEGFVAEQNDYRVNHAVLGRRTPLSIAAGRGHLEIAKLLLSHPHIQPDIPDSDSWTPLFWSAGGKHLDITKLLVSDDRVSLNHVDRGGRNVLSWAASEGSLEIVKYLTTQQDLRCQDADKSGRTALSWAAGNGHLETTKHLRRTQLIDVSKKDKDGRNAISWACSAGHGNIVTYLIQYDKEGVDEKDKDGWTPLAWALFSQTPQSVQALLDSGLVDVNKKDNDGRSALSFAAGYGYLDIVQMLLNIEGIEVDSKDKDGGTPLKYAGRHQAVVELLQKHR